MTDLETSDYWQAVATESRKLIAQTRQLCSERSALLARRRKLLGDYTTLGDRIQEIATRFSG